MGPCSVSIPPRLACLCDGPFPMRIPMFPQIYTPRYPRIVPTRPVLRVPYWHSTFPHTITRLFWWTLPKAWLFTMLASPHPPIWFLLKMPRFKNCYKMFPVLLGVHPFQQRIQMKVMVIQPRQCLLRLDDTMDLSPFFDTATQRLTQMLILPSYYKAFQSSAVHLTKTVSFAPI